MSEQGILPTLDTRRALVLGPVFLEFEIGGKPGYKGRHRSRLVIPKDAWTGFGPNAFILKPNIKKLYIQHYADTETAQYEAMIGEYAGLLMRGRAPSERPIAVMVHAFIPVPKSWSARDRADALFSSSAHMGDPSSQDLLECCCDCLSNIVWLNRNQIIDTRIIKRYSDTPALRIEVREFVPSP